MLQFQNKVSFGSFNLGSSMGTTIHLFGRWTNDKRTRTTTVVCHMYPWAPSLFYTSSSHLVQDMEGTGERQPERLSILAHGQESCVSWGDETGWDVMQQMPSSPCQSLLPSSFLFFCWPQVDLTVYFALGINLFPALPLKPAEHLCTEALAVWLKQWPVLTATSFCYACFQYIHLVASVCFPDYSWLPVFRHCMTTHLYFLGTRTVSFGHLGANKYK